MLSAELGSRRRRLPRWLAVTLLVALAVLTVAAVVLASSLTRNDSPEAGTVPTVTLPTPEPEPEPEPEPAPAYVAPVMQRLLTFSADDSDHILRAIVGSCPDPAGSLEVSFDGGEIWEAGVIGSVDARRLLQLDASDEITRIAVQVGDCGVQVARSFMGGTAWELDPDPPALWFIDPTDATVVRTPAGAHTLPCEAVGLSAVDSRGAVLCSDSTVLFSENDGEGWSAPVAVPNGVAVGAVVEGFAVASLGEDECAGVRTRLLAGGSLGEPGACLDVADAGGGQTAVAGNDDVWLLWSGAAFLRSNDLGSSWG